MLIRAKASLRISFAGGGTDVSPYPQTEEGYVISATIINMHRLLKADGKQSDQC